MSLVYECNKSFKELTKEELKDFADSIEYNGKTIKPTGINKSGVSFLDAGLLQTLSNDKLSFQETTQILNVIKERSYFLYVVDDIKAQYVVVEVNTTLDKVYLPDEIEDDPFMVLLDGLSVETLTPKGANVLITYNHSTVDRLTCMDSIIFGGSRIAVNQLELDRSILDSKISSPHMVFSKTISTTMEIETDYRTAFDNCVLTESKIKASGGGCLSNTSVRKSTLITEDELSLNNQKISGVRFKSKEGVRCHYKHDFSVINLLLIEDDFYLVKVGDFNNEFNVHLHNKHHQITEDTTPKDLAKTFNLSKVLANALYEAINSRLDTLKLIKELNLK